MQSRRAVTRAGWYFATSVLGVALLHAYLLLLGLFNMDAWPVLLAGVASLMTAAQWAFPPIRKEAWSEAGRMRGWSPSTKRWTWVAIQVFAAALILSAGTLLV